jgi:predicted SprT family Zn-dependent metalloprotease
MLLTESLIKSEYQAVLNECLARYTGWKIKPNGFGFTSHKTKFGFAYTSGLIEVNQKFIGTTAIDTLRDTLRHEMAHLAVGLEQHHNKRFKQVATHFGCLPSKPGDSKLVIDSIEYKYSVYALTECGGRHFLGQCHRRTSYYDDPVKKKMTLELDGKHLKILSFEFVTN